MIITYDTYDTYVHMYIRTCALINRGWHEDFVSGIYRWRKSGQLTCSAIALASKVRSLPGRSSYNLRTILVYITSNFTIRRVTTQMITRAQRCMYSVIIIMTIIHTDTDTDTDTVGVINLPHYVCMYVCTMIIVHVSVD